jgi:hypothetical protein
MAATPEQVRAAVEEAFDADPPDVPHWSVTPDFDDDGKLDGGEIDVEIDIKP